MHAQVVVAVADRERVLQTAVEVPRQLGHGQSFRERNRPHFHLTHLREHFQVLVGRHLLFEQCSRRIGRLLQLLSPGPPIGWRPSQSGN